MFSLRAPRLTRPLLIILAGVLTLAGLLFASGPGASAHAATTRAARTGLKADTSAPKPTIVLVHGAWADSAAGTRRDRPAPAGRLHRLRPAQPAAGPVLRHRHLIPTS